MTDMTHFTPHALPTSRLRRLVQAIIAAIAESRALRKDAKVLANLSAEQLHDLGVDRRDVAGPAKRPFGGNPIADYARYSGLGSPLGR